jgi:hypothetical protein
MDSSQIENQVFDDQDEIRFASAAGNISRIPEVGSFNTYQQYINLIIATKSRPKTQSGKYYCIYIYTCQFTNSFCHRK